MNWRTAKRKAREGFPDTKPTRLAFAATLGDGVAVLAGHDEATTLVLYDRLDLYRVKWAVEAAITEIEKDKKP